VNSRKGRWASICRARSLRKSCAIPNGCRCTAKSAEIFCLFSDLEGFTKLTHAVEPEVIARLLNDYLDRLSAVVLQYGGTLDKFVGDAVVAFWGAPIAYPDDGERAVRAAYAMYLAGEEFRKNVPEGVPRIGRTRVGLHYGEAIVGNFGGRPHPVHRTGRCDELAARLKAPTSHWTPPCWSAGRRWSDRGSTGSARWERSRCAVAPRRSTCSSRCPTCPRRNAPVADLITAHDAGDSDRVLGLRQAAGNGAFRRCSAQSPPEIAAYA
jgi:adenylate cyclase